MQRILCSMAQSIPIQCSGFHALWLNAVYSIQRGKLHPDWMQWIPCSVIECRGFHALWRNGSRLYAAESMQRDDWMDSMQLIKMHPDWMQWIPCSIIECRGFHALWRNGSRLYAVESMQRGPLILIECSGLRAAWLNAVNSMQCGKMHPDWMQWIWYSLV